MKGIKKLNRDGYIGEGATTRELLKKVNELVETHNNLKEAYHAEMSALSSMVAELRERLEIVEKK